MNSTTLKIGGALVLLAVTLIGRINGLITDDVLILIAVFSVMVAGSYAFAIGFTEWFKRRKFSQIQIECINDVHSTGCDKEKRRTYDVAVRSGGGAMATCGIIFILIDGADWRTGIVVAVFWLFASAIVGVTAPLVWRMFRKRYLTIAGENEALDRPADKTDQQ